MSNLIRNINRLILGGKRHTIAFLRLVIYYLLYARIALLKTFHILFVRRIRIKSVVQNIGGAFLRKISLRSLFRWDLSHSVSRVRIFVVIIGFSLIFLVISVRLLIVASSDYINFQKTMNRKLTHRVDITDRNNNLLAVNLPGASLYANPRKIAEPEESLKKLLLVIPDLDAKRILADLKSNKSFVWIKRDVAPLEHEKIYNLGMPGFGFEREQKRIYTYGNLLSHVIGYVGRDMNGLAGIEQFFEKFITGQKEKEDRTTMGDVLQLSIDVRIQNILSEEMEIVMKKFKAKGAAGIIVDPNNGEILALVSKPDFDPHNPGAAKSEQLFNMVTQGVYEMGSGMKALTVAVGLDTGSTAINDAYDLSYLRVQGFQVKDHPRPLKGWHSVPHIFLKSSNVGLAQIILATGKQNILEYLRKLKLLEPLQIEVLERSRPLFPNFSRWSDLSLITMSYGYGISVSPAHFIQAMMPIINGGMIYPLTLTKRDPKEKLVGERVFQESTSLAMRKLMRLVVSDGTGSKAEVKGYYVGGKTGTANIAHAGGYDKDRRMSSFFGIVPASNPKYMIYIVYNEPVGIKESFGFAGGGWTAAPTVGAVLRRLVALYGITKLDEESEEIQELNNIEYKIRDET
ncbi:MAG: penicillin-binding protein 2 [Rickettsiaceae bacterium]|nr:penicillin-binding protein 2 [Rickettsiaceae bacterium]